MDEEDDGGLSFHGTALYLWTAGNTGIVIGLTPALLDDVFGVDVSDGLGLVAWLVFVAGFLSAAVAWGLVVRERRRGRDA